VFRLTLLWRFGSQILPIVAYIWLVHLLWGYYGVKRSLYAQTSSPAGEVRRFHERILGGSMCQSFCFRTSSICAYKILQKHKTDRVRRKTQNRKLPCLMRRRLIDLSGWSTINLSRLGSCELCAGYDLSLGCDQWINRFLPKKSGDWTNINRGAVGNLEKLYNIYHDFNTTSLEWWLDRGNYPQS
jgi:hypothetical protein